MKTLATTLLSMSVFLTVPAFADQSHHPDQAAAEVPAGAISERMQDNLKIVRATAARRGAKTDEARQQAMAGAYADMRENMGMAQGMQGGMMVR